MRSDQVKAVCSKSTISLAFAVLFAMSLFTPATAAGLSFALEQANVRSAAKGEVWIDIVWSNWSGRRLTVAVPNGENGAEVFYRISVVDSAGNSLKRTSYGQSLADADLVSFSTHMATLLPGQSVRIKCRLDRLFVIPGSGRYTVTVGEPRDNGLEATAKIASR